MGTEKTHPEGILGRKLGMTQVFSKDGQAIPVTVIEAGPCTILQVKSREKDGYSAVQLGFLPKKAQRVSKAMKGHFAKVEKGAFEHVEEMRCDVEGLKWTAPGQELRVGDLFQGGELVDVAGVTIGRGFSGVFRRYRVSGQPSTRGTHEVRRHIGSIGCRKYPGHVFKNQKMAGRHGNFNVTIQNLEVIGVRPEDNTILIKGGVPGARGSLVVVRRAIKSYGKAEAAKQAA